MKKEEIDLFVLFNILWKKKGLIFFSTLIVAIITAGITLLLPKSYKAQAIILPNNAQASENNFASTIKAFGFGSLLGSDSGQNSLLTILKSRKILELLNDKYNFKKRFKTKYFDVTLREIKKRFHIDTGDEDQIIISMELRDKNIVANAVNYTIHCLDSLNIALSNSNAKINRIFLEKRLTEVKDSLRFYENQMKDFMKNNNIISITDQVKYTIENAAKLNAEIEEKQIELKLKQNIYGENNLIIENLKKNIALLKKSYNNNFMQNGKEIYLNLNNVTSNQLTYIRLKRMVEFYTQLMEFIAPQYEQAKIDEIKKLPTFQVIDYARTPDTKSKPRRALIVFVVTIMYFLLLLTLILILNREPQKEIK